jgi:hypothetical protein
MIKTLNTKIFDYFGITTVSLAPVRGALINDGTGLIHGEYSHTTVPKQQQATKHSNG